MRARDPEKELLVKENAMRLLVDDGFEGFSMAKLAKACSISVATVYIYYKDKDDLIRQLAVEEGNRMLDCMLEDFSPEMSFEEGLRRQWKNRANYHLKFPTQAAFSDVIRNSPHCEFVHKEVKNVFKPIMEAFIRRAVANKELSPMPMEVFWSVAYGPLYNLLRFHREGKSMGGRSFEFSHEYMEQALTLVLKALRP